MAKKLENERVQTLNQWGEERLKFDDYPSVIAVGLENGKKEEDLITESEFIKFWRESKVRSPKY